MIESFNAKFEINNIKAVIKEKATNKEFVDHGTWLVANGHYRSWWECPGEPECGQEQFVEQDIDVDSIKLDPEIYDDDFELVNILNKIDDNDWKVVEGSLEK